MTLGAFITFLFIGLATPPHAEDYEEIEEWGIDELFEPEAWRWFPTPNAYCTCSACFIPFDGGAGGTWATCTKCRSTTTDRHFCSGVQKGNDGCGQLSYCFLPADNNGVQCVTIVNRPGGAGPLWHLICSPGQWRDFY